jgi:hypothetical protein
MVGHEQCDSAVPQEILLIMRERMKNCSTGSGAAKVVLPTRFTIDGNEKEETVWHPLRNSVREAFANGAVHVRRIERPDALSSAR